MNRFFRHIKHIKNRFLPPLLPGIIMILVMVIVGSFGLWMAKDSGRLLYAHPMTKWEADGYELYLRNREGDFDGILVCHLENGKTVMYDVDIGRIDIGVVDTRTPIGAIPGNTMESNSNSYCYLGYFEYNMSISKRSFRLKYSGNDDGVSPEWLWEGAPEKELKFKLTKKNLKKEDIPELEFDPALDYCPVFFPGSEWLSDDGKVSIATKTWSIDSPEFYAQEQSLAGKATFLGENPEEYSVVFGQLDTKLYIGNLLSDQEDAICDRTLAKEVWQCEYAEDHFVAEVIKSDRYPVGTILVFTKTK